jgi:hypothetical protein
MGTCCARRRDPNISLVSSTASGLAMWLAFLYPATELLRLLDGLAAAIDPRLSIAASLHDLFAANASSVAAIAAGVVALRLLGLVRSSIRVTVPALDG